MAIVKQGSVTLNAGAKGDKGDTGSGGGTSPSVKAVTTQSELTEPLGVGIKELSIQADFALSSDVTIPNGAIISDGGGVITVGANTITFQNNSFKSEYTRTFIDLGQNGVIYNGVLTNGVIVETGTVSSYTDGNINICWFGLVDDGIVGDVDTVQSGTDNRNVFIQAQKIYNNTGDKAIITKGNYAFSVVTSAAVTGWVPTNLYLTGSASLEMIGDVKLLVLPNALQKYDAITFSNSNNSYLKGGLLIGDLRNHTFGGSGVDDSAGCHGIATQNRTKYVTITTPVSDFPGDCMISNSSAQVLYSAANGTQIVEADYQIGVGGNPLATINATTGATEASTVWAYTKLYDISGTSANGDPIMVVGSHAYGSDPFVSNTVRIAWYDATAISGDSTTGFIEATDLVDIYLDINTKPEYKSFRLITRIPPVWGDYFASILSDRGASFITYKPKYLERGVRQGFSNISKNSVLDGIWFKNNGARYDGLTGSPAYHIDVEDGYQKLRDITISRCVFDAANNGIIILKGTMFTKIYGNTFNYSTDPTLEGRTVSLQNGHYTQFYDNVCKDISLTTGRLDEVYNNTFWDSKILTSNEGGRVYENTFYNSQIGLTAIGTGIGNYGSVEYRDNTVILDREIESDESVISFLSSGNEIIWKNLVVECNNVTHTTSANKLTSLSSTTSPFTGYIDGMEFRNPLTPSLSAGYISLPVCDINNLKMPTNLTIQTFGAKDAALTNSKVNGFIWLRFQDYANTGVGTFTTYTVDNVDINIDDATRLGTFYAISVGRSANRPDVNIEVKNSTIDIVSGNKFLDLWHYGTTLFEDVKFATGTVAQSIDITSRAQGDVVTFKDCEFNDNITSLVVRVGDKILFTKPNKLCPSYADNATALSALGEGYYYKDTTTGKFEVTIA